MQSPTLTLVLIFTTTLSLLTPLSVALPLAVPQNLLNGGGGGGQSAGNIVIASGVLMEIGLFVAGMGLWV
jgi:hypothetical protein